MKAIICDRAGGPDVMRMAEVADPVPAPGEGLVRIRATAVNRADILQREGNYPPPEGVSPILGLEAAGEVVAVPTAAAHDLRVGERVMCLLAGGGYAEFVAVPVGHVMRIPDRLSFAEAAAIPEAFLTAHLALIRLGNAGSGDIVLVHAVASGVGTAAAQICAAIGARCIGTSRGPVRAHAADRWGATPVAVRDGSFAPAVRDLTDGHGADVILDLVGAAYWQQNVASLARHGRIVLTGLVGGRRAEVDLGDLFPLQATVIASTLRGRTGPEKTEIVSEFTRWGLPLFDTGVLTPVVDRVLPLDRAADAHRHVAADAAVGKVILWVSG